MSARELRGQKRLQSNADEATTTSKRSKTTNKDDEEGSEVELQPVKKAATKSKGKKANKPRYVSYPYWGLITSLHPFGRMTAAQRAAEDNIEDAKPAPVHLTP
jgi:hypothetical protein